VLLLYYVYSYINKHKLVIYLYMAFTYILNKYGAIL